MQKKKKKTIIIIIIIIIIIKRTLTLTLSAKNNPTIGLFQLLSNISNFYKC